MRHIDYEKTNSFWSKLNILTLRTASFILFLLSFSSLVAAQDQAEIAFWDTIKTSTDASEYKAYLLLYPDGHFSAIAKIRIKKYTPENPDHKDQASDKIDAGKDISGQKYPAGSQLGFLVHQPSKEFKERWSLTKAGLVINKIVPEGAAEKAGLRVDDILLELNSQSVVSIDGLKAQLKLLEENSLALMVVMRAGEKKNIFIRINRTNKMDRVDGLSKNKEDIRTNSPEKGGQKTDAEQGAEKKGEVKAPKTSEPVIQKKYVTKSYDPDLPRYFVPLSERDYHFLADGETEIFNGFGKDARRIARTAEPTLVRVLGRISNSNWLKVEFGWNIAGYIKVDRLGAELGDISKEEAKSRYLPYVKESSKNLFLTFHNLHINLNAAQKSSGRFHKHAAVYSHGKCPEIGGYVGDLTYYLMLRSEVLIWSEGPHIKLSWVGQTPFRGEVLQAKQVLFKKEKEKTNGWEFLLHPEKIKRFLGFKGDKAFFEDSKGNYFVFTRCEDLSKTSVLYKVMVEAFSKIHYEIHKGLILEPEEDYILDKKKAVQLTVREMSTSGFQPALNKEKSAQLPEGYRELVKLSNIDEDPLAVVAGLKDGDILLGIDETKINDLFIAREMIKNFKVGQSYIFKISRGAEDLEIKYTADSWEGVFKSTLERARQGDKNAIVMVADIIENKYLIEEPPQLEGAFGSFSSDWKKFEASKWFMRATEQDDVVALYKYGKHLHGQKSYKLALPYLFKAAEGQSGAAMNLLAKMYEEGVGFPAKSAKEAEQWYIKAAKAGDVDAMLAYARIILKRDSYDAEEKAIEWLQKASQANNHEATELMADLYITKRQEYKPKLALELYKKGIWIGFEREVKLGKIYREGIHTKKDLDQSVHWYRGSLSNIEGLMPLIEIYEKGVRGKKQPEAVAEVFMLNLAHNEIDTESYIEKYYTKPTKLMSAASVKALQKLLVEGGFYKGKIDGKLGDGVFKAAQKVHESDYQLCLYPTYEMPNIVSCRTLLRNGVAKNRWAEMHYYLARDLAEGLKNDEALLEIKKALNLKPENKTYLLLAAKSYVEINSWQAALDAMLIVNKNHPKPGYAEHIILAKAYAGLKNMQQSLEHAQAAYKMKAKSHEALYLMAQAELALNLKEQAQKSFYKAMMADPSRNAGRKELKELGVLE